MKTIDKIDSINLGVAFVHSHAPPINVMMMMRKNQNTGIEIQKPINISLSLFLRLIKSTHFIFSTSSNIAI